HDREMERSFDCGGAGPVGGAAPPHSAGHLPPTTPPPLPGAGLSSLVSLHPLPLHAVFPFQAVLAPAQAPLPLQSLMPEHFTVLALSLLLSAFACAAFAAKSPATVDAMTAPLTTFFNMHPLLCDCSPARSVPRGRLIGYYAAPPR